MMNKVYCLIMTGALVVATGCNKESTSTAPPKPGQDQHATRKLTVKSPGDQNVTQDQTDDMTISISRTDIGGPVDIELKGLPTGVSLVTKEMTIPAGKDSLKVTVKADPKAPPEEKHKVQVVAHAKDQPDLQPVTVDFNMNVKPK